jgi:UDP-glucose 4-epimerase
LAGRATIVGAAGFVGRRLTARLKADGWDVFTPAERDLALESSPHVRRDYIHLDDVVSALIALATADAPGIVNVASGEIVSNREIAEVFEQAGWTIRFSSQADPPPPPKASAAKLAALGVTPRPVKDVVRGYLEGLKA